LPSNPCFQTSTRHHVQQNLETRHIKTFQKCQIQLCKYFNILKNHKSCRLDSHKRSQRECFYELLKCCPVPAKNSVASTVSYCVSRPSWNFAGWVWALAGVDLSGKSVVCARDLAGSGLGIGGVGLKIGGVGYGNWRCAQEGGKGRTGMGLSRVGLSGGGPGQGWALAGVGLSGSGPGQGWALGRVGPGRDGPRQGWA
jgi:hypothetical protein